VKEVRERLRWLKRKREEEAKENEVIDLQGRLERARERDEKERAARTRKRNEKRRRKNNGGDSD
jgi:U4/U6.U5 tri-snRNP component SNU23